MPKMRHEPEEMVAKLRQVDVLVAQATAVALATSQTRYRQYRGQFCSPSGPIGQIELIA